MTSCNFNISYINPCGNRRLYIDSAVLSAAFFSKFFDNSISFFFDTFPHHSLCLSTVPAYFPLFLSLFPFKCTTCTNHTFDSPVIHFIHTNPPKLCGKLSTSKNADFTPFRSYTPSYPHYPQVFSSPQVDFTFSLYLFYFCEHLIKFIFLTTFFPYPIDKPGRPRIVFELLYTFFYLFKFSHFSCILVVFYRILCYT